MSTARFAVIPPSIPAGELPELRRRAGVLDAKACSVRIERVSGHLTDHYDPRDNVIRLSDNVFGNTSTAAIGVACHEAGHAVQHAVKYVPIQIRSAIIPITNIGSRLSMPLILVGLLFSMYSPQMYYLVYAGIACFGLAAIFQLVTLPTEFNASRRALAAIESGHLLYDEEIQGSQKNSAGRCPDLCRRIGRLSHSAAPFAAPLRWKRTAAQRLNLLEKANMMTNTADTTWLVSAVFACPHTAIHENTPNCRGILTCIALPFFFLFEISIQRL